MKKCLLENIEGTKKAILKIRRKKRAVRINSNARLFIKECCIIPQKLPFIGNAPLIQCPQHIWLTFFMINKKTAESSSGLFVSIPKRISFCFCKALLIWRSLQQRWYHLLHKLLLH